MWWECARRCPPRADVLDRAALIIRARARLEEAMAAPATPVRPFLIEVARSRLAKKNGDYFNGYRRHRLHREYESLLIK